jgi:hypothetical protein
LPVAPPEVGPWWEPGCADPPALCGGPDCLDPDREVEVEVLPDDDDLLGVGLELVGVVLELVGVVLEPVVVVAGVVTEGVVTVGVVTVGVVTVACGQDSVMLLTGCVMFSEDSGAPCGSWK